MRRFAIFLLALPLFAGCALYHLASYQAFPDYPAGPAPETAVPGLSQPVEVTVLPDGRYKISAQNENDLYYMTGYLQARDRMFQMDLLRHMAEGKLAEMVGNIPFGEGTALDVDRFNRFLGLTDEADAMMSGLTPEEKGHVDSYVAGVNHWIKAGNLALEHKLLGFETVAPWTAVDSLAVFRMVMFGMTHNYSREIRRLLVACDAGIDAMERVWPTRMEFGPTFLPPDALRKETYELPPALAPELASTLPGICPKRATQTVNKDAGRIDVATSMLVDELYLPLAALRHGISASNNWVISGKKSASGKPILENDPHLPHISPPILWGVHQALPDREATGFTVPGLPLLTFGHNFHVSWGATINTVDLQDLYVEKPSADGKGVEYDGKVEPFRERTEVFHVKGGEDVKFTVRYTRHGPLLNDMETFLADRIPLTALRLVPLDNAGDMRAARAITFAKSATEFVDGIRGMDSACISWVFADTAGNFGFTSPCRVPNRKTFWGSFPVPGWDSKYEWAGFVPKEELPFSLNPERGWIATANNQSVPFNKFPTALNNDANPPNRYVRLSEYFDKAEKITKDDMAKLALDTGISFWPQIRAALEEPVCKKSFEDETASDAAKALCAWNGMQTADSEASTIFELLTNAMLDRALGDELSEGPNGKLWRYMQLIPHFEAQVHWSWVRKAEDPVWDDVRTPMKETRADILAAAFDDAVRIADDRYGSDVVDWKWGEVRPFFIKHPFGSKGGLLGSIFNGQPLPGAGGPETVFKNQFARADREQMHPGAGPAIRYIVDMSDPRAATFAYAGGESGWTKSPYYGNMTADWMTGTMHPMTPEGGKTVRFVPAAGPSTTP